MPFIGRTHNALMIILHTCHDPNKNLYTKIGVYRTIELLKQYHGIIIKPRRVYQCLEDLEKWGMITRKKRYKHESDGTIRQLSSMRSITLKGASYLLKKKVIGALKLMKKILAWMKNRDKRWPTREDYIAQRMSEMDEQKRRISGNPIFSVGKLIENIG